MSEGETPTIVLVNRLIADGEDEAAERLDRIHRELTAAQRDLAASRERAEKIRALLASVQPYTVGRFLWGQIEAILRETEAK